MPYTVERENHEVALVLNELITGETVLKTVSDRDIEKIDKNWTGKKRNPINVLIEIFPNTHMEIRNEIRRNWIEWESYVKRNV